MDPTLDEIDLDTVRLGRTGLRTNEFQLGTWRFGRVTEAGNVEIDEARAHELLDGYEAAGGRYIDRRRRVRRRRLRALDRRLARRARPRALHDRVEGVLADPDGDPNSRGTNRKNVRHRVDALLDRLDTDYLDVLYIHRWDDETPARELMKTLNGLVESGKVHYLGASTLRPNAWKVARANEIARSEGWEPFNVLQPRYNLVDREIEGEYLEFARQQNLAVSPWSPLGQGS